MGGVYKRKRGSRPYLTNYTDDAMKKAVAAVKRGMSIRKASKEFNVPNSTLQRHVSGI